jgi:hypothetical protein
MRYCIKVAVVAIAGPLFNPLKKGSDPFWGSIENAGEGWLAGVSSV